MNLEFVFYLAPGSTPFKMSSLYVKPETDQNHSIKLDNHKLFPSSNKLDLWIHYELEVTT